MALSVQVSPRGEGVHGQSHYQVRQHIVPANSLTFTYALGDGFDGFVEVEAARVLRSRVKLEVWRTVLAFCAPSHSLHYIPSPFISYGSIDKGSRRLRKYSICFVVVKFWLLFEPRLQPPIGGLIN